jgi:hypothetical protein
MEGIAMATNRTPISRPRVPSLTPEIIALFTELEGTPTPRHWRKTQEFARKSQRLAGLLGLSDAWWMSVRVEKADDPRPRKGLAAHDWWPRVQAVRAALLEALEQARERQPADEPAHPAP